jgi:transposase
MSLKREEIRILCQTNPDAIIALIEQQEARIAKLEARISELEARLNQNSRNSSRPPSTDIYSRPQSPRKKGERSPGGQKGHKGHTLTKVDLPDEIIVHTIPICEGCGASLESEVPVKVEWRQVHDIPPPNIIITEHRVESKRCPQCGRNNRAEFPPDVQYPVQYGQYLKALMVYLCIFQLLPYDRVSEFFSDLFGRSLSKATLVKAVSECSQNLIVVEERIRELLAGAQVLNVDETGMRVVGIRQWLHVASTDLLTIYAHHRKRGSEAMDAMLILPRFRGVMVHDFWSPYFHYLSRHALCNAHIIRELKGISENYGQKWSDQLHDLIYEIKVAVDTTRHTSSSLNHQLRTDFEERYSRILEAGMKENPALPLPEAIAKRGRKKQSKAKNLLDRCQKYRKEILTFMDDFTIPFTNNLAERDIRMMKLQQKISGTFRSEEGASNFCRVRGYISTVKKHKLPVMISLMGAFERAPFMPSATHRSP